MAKVKITDEAGHILNRNGRYYVQVDIDGRRVMRVIRDGQGVAVTTLPDAKRHRPATLAAIRAEKAKAKTEKVSLADLPNVYLESLKAYRKRKGAKHADTEGQATVGISQATIRASLSYLHQFIEFLRTEYPAVKDASAITPVAAEKFMVSRAALKDSSYNRVLAALRQVFNVLPHTRAANPFLPVQRRPRKDVEATTAKKARFTPAQLATMQLRATGWIRPAMFVAYHTGQRLSDVCTLQWSDIDPDGFIRYKSRKTSQAVEVYAPDVLPHLAEWRDSAAIDWAMFDPNNSRFLAAALGVSVGTAFALVKASPIEATTPAGIAAAVAGMRRRLIGERADQPVAPRALSVVDPAAPVDLHLDPIPEALKDYVFPRQADAYLGITRKRNPAQPVKEFQRFLKDVCGFDTTDTDGQQTLGFHSFRVNYVSSRRAAGESLEDVADDVGHSNTTTTQGYHRQTPEERRAKKVKQYRPLPPMGQASQPDGDDRAALLRRIQGMDDAAVQQLLAALEDRKELHATNREGTAE